jgi:hypothetical protein
MLRTIWSKELLRAHKQLRDLKSNINAARQQALSVGLLSHSISAQSRIGRISAQQRIARILRERNRNGCR